MYNIKENLIDFLLFSYQKIVYGYFVSFYSRGQWAKQPRLCGYLANAARGKCPVGANARPLGTKEQARAAPAYGGVFAYRNLRRLLGGAGKCL